MGGVGGGEGGSQLLGTQEYLTKPHKKNNVSTLWMRIYVVKKKNSVDKSISCRTSEG